MTPEPFQVTRPVLFAANLPPMQVAGTCSQALDFACHLAHIAWKGHKVDKQLLGLSHVVPS